MQENTEEKNSSQKEESKPLPIHRVKFKKEPIWLKANFAGRYNGIKFRFTYNEYMGPEEDDGVIRKFKFNWPGRVPEHKEYAEKGIQELYIKLRDSKESTITMKVIDDKESLDNTEEEKALLEEVLEGDITLEEQVKKEYNETI